MPAAGVLTETMLLRAPQSFFRRTARTLVYVLAIVAAAAAINVIGIRAVGSVNEWNQWLAAHAEYFLIWRGFLYVATGVGWWWMRTRVLCRERESGAKACMLRTEIAAVLAIVMLELAAFLLMR